MPAPVVVAAAQALRKVVLRRLLRIGLVVLPVVLVGALSLGLLTIVVLVALGLGVVVQESMVVFNVLKLAGAAYLVYLGVEAVCHRRDFLAGVADDPGRERPPMTWRRAIRQGYVVGVTNPKAYMILAAVLPQFVDRGAGHVQVQLLLLGLLAFAIDRLLYFFQRGLFPYRPADE